MRIREYRIGLRAMSAMLMSGAKWPDVITLQVSNIPEGAKVEG